MLIFPVEHLEERECLFYLGALPLSGRTGLISHHPTPVWFGEVNSLPYCKKVFGMPLPQGTLETTLDRYFGEWGSRVTPLNGGWVGSRDSVGTPGCKTLFPYPNSSIGDGKEKDIGKGIPSTASPWEGWWDALFCHF